MVIVDRLKQQRGIPVFRNIPLGIDDFIGFPATDLDANMLQSSSSKGTNRTLCFEGAAAVRDLADPE